MCGDDATLELLTAFFKLNDVSRREAVSSVKALVEAAKPSVLDEITTMDGAKFLADGMKPSQDWKTSSDLRQFTDDLHSNPRNLPVPEASGVLCVKDKTKASNACTSFKFNSIELHKQGSRSGTGLVFKNNDKKVALFLRGMGGSLIYFFKDGAPSNKPFAVGESVEVYYRLILFERPEVEAPFQPGGPAAMESSFS